MNQMASMVGPTMMSHANMMRPGSVTSDLGIVEGRATGDSVGGAFGRDINLEDGWRSALRLQGLLAGDGLEAPNGEAQTIEVSTRNSRE